MKLSLGVVSIVGGLFSMVVDEVDMSYETIYLYSSWAYF